MEMHTESTELKVEVIMYPHTWQDKNKPHSWNVYKWTEEVESWMHVVNGWAETPLNAYIEAEEYINKHYITQIN